MAKKEVVKTINKPEDAAGKAAAIKEAMAKIEKEFGEGSIMRLGNAPKRKVEVIPTGSLGIDLALGIGGLPRGRITEIYGPESSGKTTVSLHIIAEAQKMGGEVVFIDAEHALDPIYARNLGVDIDRLIVSQPDTGEQALEIAEALARSGGIDVIVIDSVAALVPKAEISGIMGDSFVGLHARLMSQALRKLTGVLNKSNTVAIFINQLREKVGMAYGNPEVTTGGRALKFYSSIRIEVRKAEVIKNGTDIIGVRTRAKIVKNKMAPPFKEAEFDIMFGEGISREGDILDIAADYDIVKKSGAWYSYEGERLGQGRDKVKEYMKDHPDFTQMLYDRIMATVKEQELEKEQKLAEKQQAVIEQMEQAHKKLEQDAPSGDEK